MSDFLNKFISILKIFLIILIVISFVGMIIFYLSYFNDIIRYRILYKNFNLIKLIFIKIDSFIYLFIPAVLISSTFFTSFFIRKKVVLIKSFLSLIIINIILILPLCFLFFNNQSILNKFKKIYIPGYKKSKIYFEKDKLYSIKEKRYYFINDNKVIEIEDGNFIKLDYKYDIDSNEVILYKVNDKKILKRLNFLEINSTNLLNKKIKYFYKLQNYFKEFYEFLLSNNSFYFIIYYFVMLILFILLPGIYSYDLWTFNELFVYIFLGILFLYLFLLSFHFTIYYLIDLKIKKIYIYLFPVILFFVIDIIIVLIENNRNLKRKMLGRMKR